MTTDNHIDSTRLSENDDAALRQLFENYRPDLGDDQLYMSQLTRRLEGMAWLNRYTQQRIRRYRMAVIVAAVAGAVAGVVMTLIFIMMPTPADMQLIGFGLSYPLIQMINAHSQFIVSVLMSFLVAVGIFGLVSMLQEFSALWEVKDMDKRLVKKVRK